MWPSRSFAFGVGPLPSRPRRTRPPEPAVGLPLPVFLIAPRREELPAMKFPILPTCQRVGAPWPHNSLTSRSTERPLGALRGVLELDAGGLELVSDRVGGREVLPCAGLTTLVDHRSDQGVHGCGQLGVRARASAGPARV